MENNGQADEGKHAEVVSEKDIKSEEEKAKSQLNPQVETSS